MGTEPETESPATNRPPSPSLSAKAEGSLVGSQSNADRLRTVRLAPTNIDYDKAISQAHDRVIGRIFGAGLSLSAVLSLGRIDSAVAERIGDALNALDTAVAELRTAAFTHLTRPDTDPPAEAPEPPAPNGHRRLARFTANEAFAYGVGRDFRRVADHSLWAHESGDWLLSARSGTVLARRVGTVFYDIETGAPLYHEDRPVALDDGDDSAF